MLVVILFAITELVIFLNFILTLDGRIKCLKEMVLTLAFVWIMHLTISADANIVRDINLMQKDLYLILKCDLYDLSK